MAEPTDEQLKAYADTLPDIYKSTLKSFVTYTKSQGVLLAPLPRRIGTALTLETIDDRLQEHYDLYLSGDTEEALGKLVARGFIEESEEPILNYKPTALGERLIAVLIDREPMAAELPELPQPAWA